MAAQTAALLTGGTTFLLVCLAVFVSRRPAGSRRRTRSRSMNDPVDELEDILAGHIDPAVGDLVRRSPERALVTALVLGLAAGYSRCARRALQDLHGRVDRADS